jgi:hypothetical protein
MRKICLLTGVIALMVSFMAGCRAPKPQGLFEEEFGGKAGGKPDPFDIQDDTAVEINGALWDGRSDLGNERYTILNVKI